MKEQILVRMQNNCDFYLILNRQKLEVSLLRSGKRQRCLLSSLLPNTELRASYSNQTRRINERNPIEKRK